MAELKYEIQEEIAAISEPIGGWQKELNLISWNEKPAKYDIRSWTADHSRMGKGITLTEDELLELKKILDEHFKK